MSRRLPSLNALRAFEAAARHSSFTEAAEELHVTHASISRHVRDLEAWLNVKLFRRLSRGVVLTEPGERYSRRLTPLFDEMNAATQAVMQPKASGELVVSVETAFAARWLVGRLGRFQAAHPEVDLTLDPDDERVNFRADPAELAIRFGEGHWPDLEIVELIDLVVFPVCSPQLLKGKDRLALSALKEQKLLHEESRQWWAEWLEQAGISDVDSSRGPKFQKYTSGPAGRRSGTGFRFGR